jgi:hypothetical protein
VRLVCSEGREGEDVGAGLGWTGLDWAVTLGVKRVLIPYIFFFSSWSKIISDFLP